MSDSYGFAREFERLLGRLLLRSRSRFWARVGREIDPAGLGDIVVRRVFEAARAIDAGTGRPPSQPALIVQRWVAWEADGRATRADVLDVRELLLDLIEDDSPLDEEQVIEAASAVLRDRMTRQALDQALDRFGKGRPMAPVIDLFAKASRIGSADTVVGQQPGVGAMDGIARLKSMARLPTGIDALDAAMGAPLRGTLGVFVGSTGDGKSMALGHCFAHAIANGFNAIYLTLEISEELILARVIANLVALEVEAMLSEDIIHQEAHRRIGVLDQQGWLAFGSVKQMTPRKTTTADMAAWYDAERHRIGGAPIDLVCVDYAALLASPAKKVRHEEIEAVAEELRSFAMERNVWVWSAAQTTTEALDRKKVKKVGVEHVAGSSGIAKTADTVVGLRRNEEDDTVTFNVAKSRNGRAGMEVGPEPCDLERGRLTVVNRTGWPFA